MMDATETPVSTTAGGDAASGAAAGAPGVLDSSDPTQVELLADPPLKPLAESAGQPKRGRPKGSVKRKALSPRARAERKKKSADAAKLLEQEIARATQIASDDKGDTPRESPGTTFKRTLESPPEPSALTDDDLRDMIGLAWQVVGKVAPSKIGGGDLSADERALLGRVWFAYLKPFLQGESSPLVVAIAGTLQVFALRALTAKMTHDAAKIVERVTAPGSAQSRSEAAGFAVGAAVGKAAAKVRAGLAEPEETVGRPTRPVDPT